MKIAYREHFHLNKANLARLKEINDIIEEYSAQGYRMTLRQLYYQLVSRDMIANNDKEYHKLSNILVKGRMAGYVDWEAIEDRIRVPNIPYYVSGPEQAVQDTIDQYRLDRQQGQDNYIELWVEKDAISNVMKRNTHPYHIRLMVNRGYSSCTAMHDSFQRMEVAINESRRVVVLYLGDHDPSGLDMVRDIDERLQEFGLGNFEIKHIALTKEQIRKYNPPPNPAKITDPRAKWYVAEHGQVSWEVDALNPKVLHDLVKEAIEEHMDIKKFNSMLRREKKDKKTLQDFADRLGEKDDE